MLPENSATRAPGHWARRSGIDASGSPERRSLDVSILPWLFQSPQRVLGFERSGSMGLAGAKLPIEPFSIFP